MYMMFSRFNTCSMVLYLTIQYQGSVHGHIKGHAYSVLLDHNKLLCLLGSQVYTGLLIASSPKISFQNTVKLLKKIHIWGRAFVSSREVVLYKTN